MRWSCPALGRPRHESPRLAGVQREPMSMETATPVSAAPTTTNSAIRCWSAAARRRIHHEGLPPGVTDLRARPAWTQPARCVPGAARARPWVGGPRGDGAGLVAGRRVGPRLSYSELPRQSRRGRSSRGRKAARGRRGRARRPGGRLDVTERQRRPRAASVAVGLGRRDEATAVGASGTAGANHGQRRAGRSRPGGAPGRPLRRRWERHEVGGMLRLIRRGNQLGAARAEADVARNEPSASFTALAGTRRRRARRTIPETVAESPTFPRRPAPQRHDDARGASERPSVGDQRDSSVSASTW